MTLPGGGELIIILLIVLVLFGGARLAGLGKGIGDFMREFRSASGGDESGKDQSDKPSDTNA